MPAVNQIPELSTTMHALYSYYSYSYLIFNYKKKSIVKKVLKEPA